MALLSNEQKIGFNASTSATAPTSAFYANSPPYFQLNKMRWLYEAAGHDDSSYEAMAVAQEGTNIMEVSFNMTRSLAYLAVKELTGYGEAETTPAAGEPTEKLLTLDSTKTSGKLTLNSFSILRDIAIFFTDGTTNSRCIGNVLRAVISSESNAITTITFTFAIREPTTASITFPSTVFKEDDAKDKYNTSFSKFTSTSTVPDGVNFDSSTFTLDTGLSDFTPKANNKYRIEGGSRSIMFNFMGTFDADVRTLWRNSAPEDKTIVMGWGDATEHTDTNYVALSMGNMVLNERSVDASLNMVMKDNLTFTSAPFSLTAQFYYDTDQFAKPSF